MVEMVRGKEKRTFLPPNPLTQKAAGWKKVVCMAKGAKIGRDWMAGPGGGREGGRAVWKWVMSGLLCVGVGDTQNMICACVCVWVKTFTMSLKKGTHKHPLSFPHIILVFFIRWYYSAPHPTQSSFGWFQIWNLSFSLLYLWRSEGGGCEPPPNIPPSPKSPHPNYKAKMLIYCIHINVKYV